MRYEHNAQLNQQELYIAYVQENVLVCHSTTK